MKTERKSFREELIRKQDTSTPDYLNYKVIWICQDNLKLRKIETLPNKADLPYCKSNAKVSYIQMPWYVYKELDT